MSLPACCQCSRPTLPLRRAARPSRQLDRLGDTSVREFHYSPGEVRSLALRLSQSRCLSPVREGSGDGPCDHRCRAHPGHADTVGHRQPRPTCPNFVRKRRYGAWGAHLTGLVQMSGTPWPTALGPCWAAVRAGQAVCRREAFAWAWRPICRTERDCGRRRTRGRGRAVEQQLPAAGAAPVEAEHELVEVGGQLRVDLSRDGPLRAEPRQRLVAQIISPAWCCVAPKMALGITHGPEPRHAVESRGSRQPAARDRARRFRGR